MLSHISIVWQSLCHPQSLLECKLSGRLFSKSRGKMLPPSGRGRMQCFDILGQLARCSLVRQILWVFRQLSLPPLLCLFFISFPLGYFTFCLSNTCYMLLT